jgi:hypothetical protein
MKEIADVTDTVLMFGNAKHAFNIGLKTYMIMKIKLCILAGLSFIHLPSQSQSSVSFLHIISVQVNISELNFMCKVAGYIQN